MVNDRARGGSMKSRLVIRGLIFCLVMLLATTYVYANSILQTPDIPARALISPKENQVVDDGTQTAPAIDAANTSSDITNRQFKVINVTVLSPTTNEIPMRPVRHMPCRP